jgi:hypothetical protein
MQAPQGPAIRLICSATTNLYIRYNDHGDSAFSCAAIFTDRVVCVCVRAPQEPITLSSFFPSINRELQLTPNLSSRVQFSSRVQVLPACKQRSLLINEKL